MRYNEPNRFLIIEDHPIFREALWSILELQPGGGRLMAAGSLQEAKALLEAKADPDLILLDLWLPDTRGYEGLIELRRLSPKTPIVVCSAFADEVVVHKVMVLGAAGFIPKSVPAREVIERLNIVLEGGVCLPEGYSPPATITNEEIAAVTARLQTLTPQQLRVLDMVRQGQLNKQIAHELRVGETTVKAHVSEVLRKMSVSNRTQAAIEVSRLDIHAIKALYER